MKNCAPTRWSQPYDPAAIWDETLTSAAHRRARCPSASRDTKIRCFALLLAAAALAGVAARRTDANHGLGSGANGLLSVDLPIPAPGSDLARARFSHRQLFGVNLSRC